jgi:chemotaxis protein CheC
VTLRADGAGPTSVSVSMDDLNALELDALREVGNIGAGRAATSLSEMTGRPIGMQVPAVKLLPLDAVADEVGGPDALVVAVHLRVAGDAEGHILFVMPPETGHTLVEPMLMGMDPGERDAAGFGDMERSALQEVGNILTSAYLFAMTQMTGLHMEPTPPAIGIDMAGSLLAEVLCEVALTGDYALLIETAFDDVGDEVPGAFVFIPTPEALGRVLTGLGLSR